MERVAPYATKYCLHTFAIDTSAEGFTVKPVDYLVGHNEHTEETSISEEKTFVIDYNMAKKGNSSADNHTEFECHVDISMDDRPYMQSDRTFLIKKQNFVEAGVTGVRGQLRP